MLAFNARRCGLFSGQMHYQNKIVEFNDVSVSYDTSTVFRNINFDVIEGSFHYVVGESGAGKTTLLRLLYMARVPYSGRIKIFGQNIQALSHDQCQMLKQQIGVVFQNFYLLDHLNALDNVTLPMRIMGVNQAQAEQKAREMLLWLGMQGYEKHYPHQLSGGQQQRVVVARALISKPKLVLADEPTGNLDDKNAIMLMELFEGLHKMGITVLIATHNKDIVAEFPHDQILLQGGTMTKLPSHSTHVEDKLSSQERFLEEVIRRKA